MARETEELEVSDPIGDDEKESLRDMKVLHKDVEDLQENLYLCHHISKTSLQDKNNEKSFFRCYEVK